MNKWFKINDRNFTASLISVQYRIEETLGYIPGFRNPRSKSCDITVEITQPSKIDYDFLIDLWENPNQITSQCKFDFTSADFSAGGCLIKSISIDDSNIKLEIISDYIKAKDLVDRRDEIIDLILNKEK